MKLYYYMIFETITNNKDNNRV